MTTNNDNLFHIAFYTDLNKNILSGKTYEAQTILEALEKYVQDFNVPSMQHIKYISNVSNMTKEEMVEIKVKV